MPKKSSQLPAKIFHLPYSTDPLFSSLNMGRIAKKSVYNIYPLPLLPELLRIIAAKGETVVRFLMEPSGKLWFAREGWPTTEIPPHYGMTGDDASSARCLTAGNMTFSADYREIVSINHKSGDFRPTFDSLKWALAVLVANEGQLHRFSITLAPKMEIEALSSSGGWEKTFTITAANLRAWVLPTFEPALHALMDQPTAVRTVTYEPPAPRPRFFKPSEPIRALILDSSEDEPMTGIPPTDAGRKLSG